MALSWPAVRAEEWWWVPPGWLFAASSTVVRHAYQLTTAKAAAGSRSSATLVSRAGDDSQMSEPTVPISPPTPISVTNAATSSDKPVALTRSTSSERGRHRPRTSGPMTTTAANSASRMANRSRATPGNTVLVAPAAAAMAPTAPPRAVMLVAQLSLNDHDAEA